MVIKFTSRFAKRYKKAPLEIKTSFQNRLDIFLLNKFNPILNNHTLTGKYKGCRSINITGDWRAIFREFEGGEVIYFDIIGTHSQLYE